MGGGGIRIRKVEIRGCNNVESGNYGVKNCGKWNLGVKNCGKWKLGGEKLWKVKKGVLIHPPHVGSSCIVKPTLTCNEFVHICPSECLLVDTIAVVLRCSLIRGFIVPNGQDTKNGRTSVLTSLVLLIFSTLFKRLI